MLTIYMLLKNKMKQEEVKIECHVYMPVCADKLTICNDNLTRKKANFKHKHKGENHAKQKELCFGT